MADLTADQFRREVPVPVLLVSSEQSPNRDLEVEITNTQTQLIGLEVPSDGPLVIPVRKKVPELDLGSGVWVGRSVTCDVVLADPTISKVHALIERQDERSYRISDLGSKNGTVLLGKPLAKGDVGVLTDGAQLVLGSLSVRFVLPDGLRSQLRALSRR